MLFDDDQTMLRKWAKVDFVFAAHPMKKPDESTSLLIEQSGTAGSFLSLLYQDFVFD